MYLDSVVFVNVDYNKELRMLSDGKCCLPITDRGKIMELLSFLKKRDDYKFIMLDVLLDKSTIINDIDSSLVDTILSLERIVIGRSANTELLDTRLHKLSGRVDYNPTIAESDFVKYPYLSGNRIFPFGNDLLPSMSLMMYQRVTSRSIEPKLFEACYSDKGLAHRSVEFAFDIKDEDVSWYDLGDDALYRDITSTKDKYIIIGANDTDQHNTFSGEESGPIIHFNAFISLMKGRHKVNLLVVIVMFTLFFCNAFYIVSKQQCLEFAKNIRNNKIRFIIDGAFSLYDWMGYPTTLFLLILLLMLHHLLAFLYYLFYLLYLLVNYYH